MNFRSISAGILSLLTGIAGVQAQETLDFHIDLNFVEIDILINHAGPGGDLLSGGRGETSGLNPPSVFSAPLPSGSGARALGQAGAFTAVADDATAASWNPAGLIQLERPEFSIVGRRSREKDKHSSNNPEFQVGDNDYESDGVNYVSFSIPRFFPSIGRNFVFSINLQEVYDFSQRFSARLKNSATSSSSSSKSASSREVTSQNIVGGDPGVVSWDLDVLTDVNTTTRSKLRQKSRTDLEGDMEFDQDGIIMGLTPAFAMEVTPKLSFGAAFNHYSDELPGGKTIRSETLTKYNGTTRTDTEITTTRESTAEVSVNGQILVITPFVPIPVAVNNTFPPETFSYSTKSRGTDIQVIKGSVREVNEFEDLEGQNGTFGFLYTLNRFVRLGGTVDLAWEGEARQKRTVMRESTVYDQSMTRVLDRQESEEVTVADVTMYFPATWAAGVLLQITPAFFITADIGQTLWSDFAFQVDGEEKINPLNGETHAGNELDDTWAARFGLEYLLMFKNFAVPLRAGFAHEERPAIGDPDVYYHYTVGSGIELGSDPWKTIIDFAYIMTTADDVTGLSSDAAAISTDVTEHQFFLSLIQHF